ncbi:phenylalanine--tRNA ligase subunit beta [Candidatus Bathyarchaeota archaeon A05DMB-2]|jgi:phenylalanyl-tRNA synthetase beta chain|nr:phenylalanine--tRNA ligase subunit beta [Candidatus Bathyarchaeota archaeon A05DMB-2]
MPTIDVDLGELEKLLGVVYRGDVEKLDADLAFVKGEVKLYNRQEGIASIEIKDTNRPDLWSVEGLARVLRGYLGIAKGLKEYVVGESVVDVSVDSRLRTIRPFMGCAVVKNVALSDTVIRGLMHLQDKLDQTYGRNRQKTSIGLYDYSLIVPPLSYKVVKPEAVRFVPLGFSESLSLAEILEQHPKGIEYGSIVKSHEVYPIIMDSHNKVLSFPPIINSNDLGRVTAETRDVLVEVTGTVHETVLNTLKLVALALADRGGRVFAATVRYESDGLKVVTPDFRSRLVELNVDYTNKILGLRLSAKRIAELLLTAGFGVESVSVESVGVLVPCYRVDVMHPVDLVEDVAVAYGYNNIAPVWRELPTTGCVKPEQRLLDVARELLVGLGFQEVLTYNLTNPETLFDRMNCEKTRVVEVANPKVVTMTCLRNWLLPSLMEFLSSNQSVEFPQRIFELGKVTLLDESKETKTRDEDWLAAVTSHSAAGFTEIKSALDTFFMNFGVNWQIRETVHPSFIEGRVGAVMVNGVEVGVVGEVYPGVLEAWKLENPVAAFEINLEKIIKNKQGKLG